MIIAENLRDWRGKQVIDPDGARIGELEAVYVDTVSDEAAFVTVAVGMIGRRRLAFVPVEGATVTPDTVRVRVGRSLAQEAPSIDVDGELAGRDEPGIFAHYRLPFGVAAGSARRLARR